MKTNFEQIFEPLTFRSGVQLRNRVLMAPMTNSSSHEDGTVSEQELAYYRERAGGVGAVITACAHVTPEGKAYVNELGADRDACIPGLAKLSRTIQDQGSKAILQIFHAGRMTSQDLIGGQQAD